MRKLIFAPLLIFLIFFVIAEEIKDDFDYETELEKMKNSGEISEGLVNNFGDLSQEEKSSFISEIMAYEPTRAKEFWKNFDEINYQSKNKIFAKLSREQSLEFLKEYSKDVGFDIAGLDVNSIFSSNGYMDTKNGFIHIDKIKDYNTNSNDPVVLVESVFDGEKRGMIFKKKSGATMEFINKEGERGFYFNPKSGQILRFGEDGKTMPEDFLSGNFNGKGSIKIDVSEEKPKLEIDFLRDEEGNSETDVDRFPSFENSKGEKFGPFKFNTKKLDDDDKEIVFTNKAEFTFDLQGKVSKVSFGYMDGTPIGGKYGDSVDIIYDLENFKSLSDEEKLAMGSYLVFDEDKKVLLSSLALSEGGGAVLGNLDKIREKTREMLLGLTPEERKELINSDNLDAMKSLLRDFGVAASEASNLFSGLKTVGTVAKILGGDDMTLTQADYIVDTLLKMNDESEYLAENPLIAAAIPSAKDFMFVEVSKEKIPSLYDVRMGGGSLSIEDLDGNMRKVIDWSTKNGYALSSNMGSGEMKFDELNFFLTAVNNPNQQITIFSKNDGKLYADGYDAWGDLYKYGSESFAVKAYTNVKGLLGQTKDTEVTKRELFAMGLSASKENALKAKELLADFEKEYNQRKSLMLDDGKITRSEMEELDKFASKKTVDYHHTLSGGDVFMYLEATGDSSRERFASGREEIAQNLNDFLSTASDSSSLDYFPRELMQAAFLRIRDDTSMQDQMATRGIVNLETYIAAAQSEAQDVVTFLRQDITGDRIEIQADSKNKIYEFYYGSDNNKQNSLYIDPIVGSAIAEVLSMVASSGEKVGSGVRISNRPWEGRFIEQGRRHVFETQTRDVSFREQIRAFFSQGSKSGAENLIASRLETETAAKIPAWLEQFLIDSSR